MDIYLLRHGTTSWNALHMIQGKTDIALDLLGRRMAEETGMALKRCGIKFDVTFSSPLSRALETARLVSDADITISPLLEELCFGEHEGRITDEMKKDPSDFFRFFHEDPKRYDACIRESSSTSSESLSDLCRRAGLFLQKEMEPLIEEGSTSNVLISGHGGINRALLFVMKGEKDLSRFWGKGLQTNCGITIVHCSSEAGSITYRTDDLCRIFYPEELLESYSSLF